MAYVLSSDPGTNLVGGVTGLVAEAEAVAVVAKAWGGVAGDLWGGVAVAEALVVVVALVEVWGGVAGDFGVAAVAEAEAVAVVVWGGVAFLCLAYGTDCQDHEAQYHNLLVHIS